jgi:quinol monooxygenase YgiN
MTGEIVHVIALFVAAPGKEKELEQVLTALVEPTRKEEGCRRYDLLRGFGSSAEFVFVEEWESVETLDAHSKSAHLKEAGTRIPNLVCEPVSVERYRQIR